MSGLVLALGLLLNFTLYIAGAQIGGWNSLQTMAALAVLNFLAILLHELGHAWAYRHVGGRVHQIAVLFAGYDVDRRQFGWVRHQVDGDVGGYVAGSFAPGRDGTRQQVLVAAAGPAANVLTGATAAVAAWTWTKPTLILAMAQPGLPAPDIVQAALAAADAHVRALWWWQQGQAALTLFAILSIGLALLNLIPYGGSDGQHIVRALSARRVR